MKRQPTVLWVGLGGAAVYAGAIWYAWWKANDERERANAAAAMGYLSGLGALRAGAFAGSVGTLQGLGAVYARPSRAAFGMTRVVHLGQGRGFARIHGW